MVDSFNRRKSEERSLESQDSRRGIGNSLEQLLFSFERPANRGSRFEIRGTNGNSLRVWRIETIGKRKLTQMGLGRESRDAGLAILIFDW
jgi:hypothetical protein